MLSILLFALFTSNGFAAPTPPAGSTEYDVKAAFLLNFGKFIEWPKAALASASDQFNICVIGKDPFGDRLERVVSGETINGKRPHLQRLAEGDAMTDCHIAFVGASSSSSVTAIIKRSKGASTLTVGEMPQFTELGGMIQFKVENQRVRFSINRNEAKLAGLDISSKLLGLAEGVR